MKEFVYFVTKGKKADVVRYVRSVKTRFGLWPSVKYTVDCAKANALDTEMKAKAFKAIKKRYGETADIKVSEKMVWPVDETRAFFIIQNDDKKEESYFSYINKEGKLRFVKDVRESYISQSYNDISETLQNVRQHGGKKVRIVPVTMNIDNTLQEGNFVIVCKSKFSGRLMFLKERMDNGEIRLHHKSSLAERLGYDEAIEWYEWLEEHHKENSYAVIVRPHIDIKASHLERYVKENGARRSVSISITLPK